MRRLALVCIVRRVTLALLAISVCPSLVSAFTVIHSAAGTISPWASNTVHYKINTTSFTTNINGLAMSADDARYVSVQAPNFSGAEGIDGRIRS